MPWSARTLLSIRLVAILAVACALAFTGLAGAEATGSPAFVSTWDTRNTGSGSSSDTQVALPLRSSGTYNFTVEWGDGSADAITAYNDAAVTHTYAAAGVYSVTITGAIQGWAFRNGGDRLKLTGISNWGPLRLGNDNGYFWGAENLQVTATDALDLTGTTDLSYAFARAGRFNNEAITTWDVSSVTKMVGMFAGNVQGTSEWTPMVFNQPIGSWTTSSLTDTSWMFVGNRDFNQDLSNWDMSDVTKLEGMFYSATAFNGSVNAWDTSHVTSLSSVFEGATAFNQPLDHWDTSSNAVLRAAFYGATAFNKPLSSWDTSHVWHFGISFTGAASFNQSLATWDMTSATQVDEMLNGTAMAWNNYDDTLIGWSSQALTALQGDMSLGAGGRKYSGAAEAARSTLVDTKGWPISGDQLIAPNTPAVTISGPLPPATQVGASASTTITVQSSGTGPVDISGVSLIGLGATDYAITSTTCATGELAALATCSVNVTFTPTHDGHRYTFVRVDSNSSTSPDLYDVSAFAYGSCSPSPFDSGAGTLGDPYVVMTLAQLNCINAMNSTGQFLFLNTHAAFRLGSDIDAGGSAAAFVPIGTWWYEFNGDFDGDGHVLRNAVVADTNAGVFPWLDGGANVHDLTIKDAQITTLESGGVLTAGAWGTTVSNVVIDGGEVVATKGWQVGGLAGMFEGTMVEVSSSASVVSVANAAWASVGGLAGQLEGSLARTYSTGPVHVSARAGDTVLVGGLLGGTNAAVTDSFSASDVTVSGGTADSRVASFVGDVWGTGLVSTSFGAGAISATTPGVVGGFVGALRENSSVSNVMWNTQTTGIASDSAQSGSSGVTTSAMHSLATYAGWDSHAHPDASGAWVLRPGYPVQLSWAPPASAAIGPATQVVSATAGTSITPTASLDASGFLGGVTYSVSPPLPGGLSMNSATGVVSGIPSAGSAAQDYTVTATGALGGVTTASIAITVESPAGPTVTGVLPASGTDAGGTSVTITGTGFLASPTVTFGGAAATNVSRVDATTITATTPAGTPGSATVVVTNTDAQSGSLASAYTFLGAAPTVTALSPRSGPVSGGTSVTITGTGFLANPTVTFGGAAATNVTRVDATTITATTPAGALGAANVVVTNVDGQSVTSTGGFTYVAASTPDPSPAPSPVPSPTPAQSTPSASNPAQGTSQSPVAAPSSSGQGPSNVSPAFEQPAQAMRVTAAVALVPANAASSTSPRLLSQEASSKIGSAPSVATKVNQPVKLLIPGLTPGASYSIKVKSGKGYITLGSVTASATGQLQLPVLRLTKPRSTTVAIVAGSGTPVYIKLSAKTARGQ